MSARYLDGMDEDLGHSDVGCIKLGVVVGHCLVLSWDQISDRAANSVCASPSTLHTMGANTKTAGTNTARISVCMKL